MIANSHLHQNVRVAPFLHQRGKENSVKPFARTSNNVETIRVFLAGIVAAGGERFYLSHLAAAIGGDMKRIGALITVAFEHGLVESELYYDKTRVVGSDRPLDDPNGTFQLRLEDGRSVTAEGSEIIIVYRIAEQFRDAHMRAEDRALI